MTMLDKSPTPVGETWESAPCVSCGCTASGTVTGYYHVPHKVGEEKVVFNGPAPDPNCTCHCHEGWRMVYGFFTPPSQESD